MNLLAREGAPGHIHKTSDFKEIIAGNNIEITEVRKADQEFVLISMKGSGITSSPPAGKYRVTNLYVNPADGKLVVEYDTT